MHIAWAGLKPQARVPVDNDPPTIRLGSNLCDSLLVTSIGRDVCCGTILEQLFPDKTLGASHRAVQK